MNANISINNNTEELVIYIHKKSEFTALMLQIMKLQQEFTLIVDDSPAINSLYERYLPLNTPRLYVADNIDNTLDPFLDITKKTVHIYLDLPDMLCRDILQQIKAAPLPCSLIIVLRRVPTKNISLTIPYKKNSTLEENKSFEASQSIPLPHKNRNFVENTLDICKAAVPKASLLLEIFPVSKYRELRV